MNKYLSALAIMVIALFVACNGDKPKTEGTTGTSTVETDLSKVDPNRGIGKFTNVEVSPTLDKALADKGKAIAESKCLSCHKITDEKLVGPGWHGVTTRRTAEWILNFTTNPDEMLNKDPEAQALLEICLVRMPNQNITDDEALAIYEYMREIDGVK